MRCLGGWAVGGLFVFFLSLAQAFAESSAPTSADAKGAAASKGPTILLDWTGRSFLHEDSIRTIRVWHPDTDTYEQSFSSERGVWNVEQSSKGDIAFLQSHVLPDGKGSKEVISVLGSDGRAKEVVSAACLREFHWSPDGTKMAYLDFGDGKKSGGISSADTKGLVIRDLASGESKAIAIEGVWQFCWASFDGMIYAKTYGKRYGEIRRCDPVAGTIENTNHKTLVFSPDGRYYLDDWVQNLGPRLLVLRARATDAVVNEGDTSPLPYLVSVRLRPMAWLDSRYLVARDCTKDTSEQAGPWYVVDITDGTVRKADGRPVALYGADRVAVAKPEWSGAFSMPLADMPIVRPDQLPLQWYPEFDAGKLESPYVKEPKLETEASGAVERTYLLEDSAYDAQVAGGWKAIRTWNPATGLYKALCRSTERGESLFSPKRSTKGSIAFLRRAADRGGYGPREESLQLLTRTGARKELARSECTLDFQWSPNGNAIAYTSFENTHESCPPPLDVTIVNVETGVSRKIPAKGCAIFWARFDGMLYIRVENAMPHRVLRYDPATGTLHKTPYQSVGFSPNGKYYYETSAGEEDSVFLVVRVRETNAVLEKGGQPTISSLTGASLYAMSWLGDSHILANACRGGKRYVLNVETGEIRVTEDRPLELWQPGQVVVVRRDGRGLAIKAIADMPIVKPEEIPR